MAKPQYCTVISLQLKEKIKGQGWDLSPGRGWKRGKVLAPRKAPSPVWASAETERPGAGYTAGRRQKRDQRRGPGLPHCRPRAAPAQAPLQAQRSPSAGPLQAQRSPSAGPLQAQRSPSAGPLGSLDLPWADGCVSICAADLCQLPALPHWRGGQGQCQPRGPL